MFQRKKIVAIVKETFFFLLTFPAAVMGQVVGIFASLSSLAILDKEGYTSGFGEQDTEQNYEIINFSAKLN